jgi:hypothetical protein
MEIVGLACRVPVLIVENLLRKKMFFVLFVAPLLAKLQLEKSILFGKLLQVKLPVRVAMLVMSPAINSAVSVVLV